MSINLIETPLHMTREHTGLDHSINGVISGEKSPSYFTGSFQGKTNVIVMPWWQAYVNNYEFGATNEINVGPAYNCKPGDRVVFEIDLWADNSTIPKTGPFLGARIAIDLRTQAWVRICEIGTLDGKPTYNPNTGQYQDASVLAQPFGSRFWKHIKIDFTVQNEYVADGWGGVASGQKATPGMLTPAIVIFVDAQDKQTEKASIAFANTALYINPTQTPSTEPVEPPIEPPIEPEVQPGPVVITSPSLAARVPSFGNSALVQVYARRLRDRFVSRELHRKIHPVV